MSFSDEPLLPPEVYNEPVESVHGQEDVRHESRAWFAASRSAYSALRVKGNLTDRWSPLR